YHLVPWIVDGLTVTRDVKGADATGGNVLTLLFRGADPDECKLILNAVIDGYQKFIDETYKDISETLFASIQHAKQQAEADIAAADAKYDEFVNTVPVAMPVKLGRGTTAVERELSQVSDRASETKIRLSEIDARISVLTRNDLSPEERRAVEAKASEWATKA